MIRGSVSKGWLYKAGGFNFDEKYYFEPAYHQEQDRAVEVFLSEQYPEIPLYNMESNLVQPEYLPEDSFYIGGIQPNLILGVLLGSDFVFPEGADSDICNKPLENYNGTSPLPGPITLMDHPLIKKFDDQIEHLKNTQPDYSIIPPYFWDRSGRATIHGFITTSFKFLGENVFILAYEEPECVGALHRWLYEAYAALISHFAEKADLEISAIHIGECTGAMISAKQFEQLVVPYADAMGKTYGAVRFHTCGQSDHLLESIGKITNLHSIDTGSNTSVSKIRSTLRNDLLIEIAPPVELMLNSSPPAEIRIWLRRTLEENRSGPIQIGYHLEPGYSMENIIALHEEGVRLKIAEPGRPPLYAITGE